MNEIRGDAKSIRSLLSGAKFAIDYYQREYRWESKQIIELINDLSEKFFEKYKKEDERSAVEKYSHYFLGSIIISDKDGQKFIIDGQQRLTSITLILIYMHRQLEDKQQLADLIYSQKFGKLSFNLDVDERTPCMKALFNGELFEENGQSESVSNILKRYQDIREAFPPELDEDALPFFADWLIENVHLVEITAYSDSDAYTIFETMNDRGLSLTPTDMLKGYLLANITDTDSRNEASKVWRGRITDLQKLGKNDPGDAIKSWLRSQYAKTGRERKRGAKQRDFELAGTEFHRWVRDNDNALGLNDSVAFGSFITNDFSFYSGWYQRIREAAEELTEGLEAIHYNAYNNFTLQYPSLLAPLRRDDSLEEIERKLRIVANYIDIMIARRIWNWKSTSFSTMQYNMFHLVILQIRGKSADELADVLTERLGEELETFKSNGRFSLHGGNLSKVRWLLARMTDFIETQAGQTSKYRDYISGGRKGYEVEHIWAKHYDRDSHKNEFDHPTDFSDYRNRIGGLLLLPKSHNASLNDMSYEKKRGHYQKQNLLAQSLHEMAYQNNPGFIRFNDGLHKKTGLKFEPHFEFKKADLDYRQKLYQAIAEQIWNPENLRRDL